MGVLNNSSSSSTPTHSITGPKPSKRHPKKSPNPQKPPPSSWEHFKSLVSCKQTGHNRASKKPNSPIGLSSCGSLCSFRDVVHSNTRVVHRADTSPEPASLGPDTRFLTRRPVQGSSSSRSLASSTVSSFSTVTSSSSSSRGVQLRRLSGCYECRMIVDPSRYPITPRGTVCACSQCGQIFPKIESLEHHQAIRHAVSNLSPEDSGRNILEIIFKSSWMNKLNPMFKIERILKVHNTPRTIQRFEECRETVKERSINNVNAKKNERCAADGNELMRFHCTVVACDLGANSSSTLCASIPQCGVCTIIRHGFQGSKGVRTTASSGRAHHLLNNYSVDDRRAMLVCRVIAGRIRRAPPNHPPAPEDETPVYDSVATSTGVFSNLEELVVFNPRAILPCFVVIYNALNLS